MTNAIKNRGNPVFSFVAVGNALLPKMQQCNLCLPRRKQDCSICRALQFA